MCLGGLASFYQRMRRPWGGRLLINGINARVLIHSLDLCLRNTQLLAACTPPPVGDQDMGREDRATAEVPVKW